MTRDGAALRTTRTGRAQGERGRGKGPLPPIRPTDPESPPQAHTSAPNPGDGSEKGTA